jgi:hypothetical protein
MEGNLQLTCTNPTVPSRGLMIKSGNATTTPSAQELAGHTVYQLRNTGTG